jgi:hypothetical protein
VIMNFTFGIDGMIINVLLIRAINSRKCELSGRLSYMPNHACTFLHGRGQVRRNGQGRTHG